MPILKHLRRSEAILLDTHIVVWLFEDSNELDSGMDEAIEQARAEQRLLISAISFLELGILCRKGRVRLKTDFKEWVRRISIQEGVTILPLTLPTMMQAYQLDGLGGHADPADLLIVASALERDAVLLTRDRILIEGAQRGHYKVFEV